MDVPWVKNITRDCTTYSNTLFLKRDLKFLSELVSATSWKTHGFTLPLRWPFRDHFQASKDFRDASIKQSVTKHSLPLPGIYKKNLEFSGAKSSYYSNCCSSLFLSSGTLSVQPMNACNICIAISSEHHAIHQVVLEHALENNNLSVKIHKHFLSSVQIYQHHW